MGFSSRFIPWSCHKPMWRKSGLIKMTWPLHVSQKCPYCFSPPPSSTSDSEMSYIRYFLYQPRQIWLLIPSRQTLLLTPNPWIHFNSISESKEKTPEKHWEMHKIRFNLQWGLQRSHKRVPSAHVFFYNWWQRMSQRIKATRTLTGDLVCTKRTEVKGRGQSTEQQLSEPGSRT